MDKVYRRMIGWSRVSVLLAAVTLTAGAPLASAENAARSGNSADDASAAPGELTFFDYLGSMIDSENEGETTIGFDSGRWIDPLELAEQLEPDLSTEVSQEAAQ